MVLQLGTAARLGRRPRGRPPSRRPHPRRRPPVARAVPPSARPPARAGASAPEPRRRRARAAVRQLLRERADALLTADRAGLPGRPSTRGRSRCGTAGGAVRRARAVPLATWDYRSTPPPAPARRSASTGATAAGAWWAPDVACATRSPASTSGRSRRPPPDLRAARRPVAARRRRRLRRCRAGRRRARYGTAGRSWRSARRGRAGARPPRRSSACCSSRRARRPTPSRGSPRSGGRGASASSSLVPATRDELAGLLGTDGDLSRIAAVATAELRGGRDDYDPAGDRVLVNPETFAALGAARPPGRADPRAHARGDPPGERTRRAGVARRGASPTSSATPASTCRVTVDGAPTCAAEVRDGRLPAALPADEDFDGSNPRLAQAYQGAWLAVRLLAERHGRAGAAALLPRRRGPPRRPPAGAVERRPARRARHDDRGAHRRLAGVAAAPARVSRRAPRSSWRSAGRARRRARARRPVDAAAGRRPQPDAGRDFTAAQIAREVAFHDALRPTSYASLALGLVVVAALGLTRAGARLVRAVARPLGGGWVWQVLLGTLAVTVVVPAGHAAAAGAQRDRAARVRPVDADLGLVVARRRRGRAGRRRAERPRAAGARRHRPRARRTWWAWGAGVTAALVVAGSFAYPLVVEPVFNYFTPLPAGPLRTEVLDAGRARRRAVDDVLVADASRRTTALERLRQRLRRQPPASSSTTPCVDQATPRRGRAGRGARAGPRQRRRRAARHAARRARCRGRGVRAGRCSSRWSPVRAAAAPTACTTRAWSRSCWRWSRWAPRRRARRATSCRGASRRGPTSTRSTSPAIRSLRRLTAAARDHQPVRPRPEPACVRAVLHAPQRDRAPGDGPRVGAPRLSTSGAGEDARRHQRLPAPPRRHPGLRARPRVRLPADEVVVYAPAWQGAAAFDAAQPFPVIRHPASLLLPVPGVLRRARDVAARRGMRPGVVRRRRPPWAAGATARAGPRGRLDARPRGRLGAAAGRARRSCAGSAATSTW